MRVVGEACLQVLILCSTVLLFVAASPAKADDLECVSTTFRMLSPSDKVCGYLPSDGADLDRSFDFAGQ
jgi:hypothetical protein